MDQNTNAYRRKLQRIAAGNRPRLLELCSGCGGMSLGLHTAGFQLAAHLEVETVANETHALNFGPSQELDRAAWATPRDMNVASADHLVDAFMLKDTAPHAFDVLAAGLPCQAFARIGRPKLRSITGDKEAFRKDVRASLYRRLLHFVVETRPLVVILENVPDILNFGGHNVPEEISHSLSSLGYVARYTLLNAAFYGVPQIRERLFLIALDARLGVLPSFPAPTHFVSLPKGYEGTRTVALKHVTDSASHFTPLTGPSPDLAPATSCRQALDDLPFLSDHLRAPPAGGRRRVSDRLPYHADRALSHYATLMRNWPGFENHWEVDGNAIRLTPRDYPIFGRMPYGSEYRAAVAAAEELLGEKLAALGRHRPPQGSAAYRRLVKETIPPYPLGKFPNKWWKLDPDLPARTLTAHLGKDSYTHIHYDGRQKRTVSVREAARLQSFPDGFKFSGNMNASLRQIGNAVPPLLALAVGRQVLRTLSQVASSLDVNMTRTAA